MAEAKKVKKGWKDAAHTTTPAQQAGAKKRQIYTLLFFVLALAGAIAAFIWLLQPAHQPYFLPLCITEYKDRHIPSNVMGDRDRDALLQGNYFREKVANTFASQEKKNIHEELLGLSKRGGNALVLYLSCHVVCDAQGELYLLPGDASVDDAKSWYKFQELLEHVKACPSDQKLLILDIMRPIADPRLGLLANDAASRVDVALEKVDDPKRLVLCACAPGQVSLASEEMGQSVFGFYVEEALRGWADGYNSDNRGDGRVSARELANFVRFRVDRWARLNRDVRQTPVLHGPASVDFPLVVLEHGQAKTSKEPSVSEYPDWLRQAWELRDGYWADRSYRIVPRVFRNIEATILRAEQHWRGGVDPEKIQRELNKDLDALKQAVELARRSIPVADRPRSLAQVQAAGKRPAQAALEELRRRLLEISQLKPDVLAEFRKKMLEDFFKAKPAGDVAARVFELSSSDPQLDRISVVYALLREVQVSPLFVETLYLRRLHDLADVVKKDGKEWPADAVRRGFQAIQEGERALACDPRAFPWVRSLLEPAAQKRHNGEIALFSSGYVAPERAAQLLNEASQEFRTIHNDHIIAVDEAYRFYDEAMTILPGLAPYLVSHPDPERWEETVTVLGQLQALLTDQEGRTGAPPELRQKTDSLHALIGLLTKPFSDTELKQLMGLVNRFELATPAQCKDIEGLLETPLLRAKQRQEVWNAARKLAAHLHDKTRQLDLEDQEKERRKFDVPEYDAKKGEKMESERAGLRAQLAVDLLRAGGLASADKLRDQVKQLRRQSESAGWPAFGDALRQAWATQLPRQFQDLKGEANLQARERLSRVIHPFDVVPDADIPTAQWYRRQVLAQWKWLAERYQYEHQDLIGVGDPLAAQFYDEAAREYRREAGGTPLVAFQIRGNPTPNLREGVRSAVYTLKLDLTSSAGPKAALDLRTHFADADWLQVKPESQTFETGVMQFEVPMTIALKSGAETTSTPPPYGFLVSARVNGRDFHHKVLTLVPGSRALTPQILLSNNPNDASSAVRDLHLRPNTRQPVFVFIRNPGKDAKKLAVELKAEGHPDHETRSAVVMVAAGETRRVAFAGKPPAEKDADPPLLRGPLQLRLLDADSNSVLDTRTIQVTVGSPRDYVEVSQAPLYQPTDKKLTVKVKARTPIHGPACRVKLVLPADRIPGFLKYNSGTLEGELPADGKELELSAEGLQFLDDQDYPGFVYLAVDGYERAYIYRTTFVARGTPPASFQITTPAVRLRFDPFFLSNAPLPVRIEVDNAPGAAIEVQLDRNNKGEYTPVGERLVGDRNESVRFTAAGPEGSLLFATSVKDWVLNVNMQGILGPRPIRAHLYDSGGRLMVKPDPQTVVIDGTPPENVRVVRVSDKGASESTPVPVLRKDAWIVELSGADPESGIKEVLLFWGEPVEGKLPPNTKPVRGQALNDDKTRWTGRLAVPADFKGEQKITAQFINQVGQSKFSAPALVQIVEPSAAVAEQDTGITGTLVRNNLKQKQGKVFVFQGQTLVDQTDIGGNGEFVFKDLKPGKYTLTAVGQNEQDKGSESVVVKQGVMTNVTIELKR